MTIYATCQLCGDDHVHSWNVRQAEFSVGKLDHWRFMLCPDCTTLMEAAIKAAVKQASSVRSDAGREDGHLAAQAETEIAPPGGLVDHLQGEKK